MVSRGMSYVRIFTGLYISILVLGDRIVLSHPLIEIWLLCGALVMGAYRAANQPTSIAPPLLVCRTRLKPSER